MVFGNHLLFNIYAMVLKQCLQETLLAVSDLCFGGKREHVGELFFRVVKNQYFLLKKPPKYNIYIRFIYDYGCIIKLI